MVRLVPGGLDGPLALRGGMTAGFQALVELPRALARTPTRSRDLVPRATSATRAAETVGDFLAACRGANRCR